MNDSAKKDFFLEGLSCAHCASTIESQICQMDGVKKASLNFATSTLSVEFDPSMKSDQIITQMKEDILNIEPDVTVKEKGKEKSTSHQTSGLWNHMNKKQLGILILGVLVFLLALWNPFAFIPSWVFYGLSYFLIGGDIVLKALRNIARGEVFDENFLMTVATIGAFAIQEFPEAVAVMLFYKVGEFFQDMAVEHSRKSITDLMDIRPDFARLMVGEKMKIVSPEEVGIGDWIVIQPGEKIPLDGIIMEGEANIDTSALTGESLPRKVKQGDSVLSGCINQNGVLKVQVSKVFRQSTVSKILELVENSASQKAPTENFITKFARYYTPAVVFTALALAVLPPLLLSDALFSDWLYRALVFLVISCPCALVISIPLGFFGGIGSASKVGILIKGGNYLEALNQVDTIVFDKTGTLTQGVFQVSHILPSSSFSEENLLTYAAYIESYSNHPIALSILQAYGKDIDASKIKNYKEIPGQGLEATVGEQKILVGNDKLMKQNHISYEPVSFIGTHVYVAVNGIYAGVIIIADQIKEDALSTLQQLKQMGIKKTIMLTGDQVTVAQEVGKELNLDEIHAELLPQHKVKKLEELQEKQEMGKKLMFVGDGINDAPVLARADIGTAMGALGSDAAIEAADMVLMTDELSKLPQAFQIAKKTRRIVLENIVFALGTKGIVLLLGALGIASMWSAIFADVGVALLSILNAMRILILHKEISSNEK